MQLFVGVCKDKAALSLCGSLAIDYSFVWTPITEKCSLTQQKKPISNNKIHRRVISLWGLLCVVSVCMCCAYDWLCWLGVVVEHKSPFAVVVAFLPSQTPHTNTSSFTDINNLKSAVVLLFFFFISFFSKMIRGSVVLLWLSRFVLTDKIRWGFFK